MFGPLQNWSACWIDTLQWFRCMDECTFVFLGYLTIIRFSPVLRMILDNKELYDSVEIVCIGLLRSKSFWRFTGIVVPYLRFGLFQRHILWHLSSQKVSYKVERINPGFTLAPALTWGKAKTDIFAANLKEIYPMTLWTMLYFSRHASAGARVSELVFPWDFVFLGPWL